MLFEYRVQGRVKQSFVLRGLLFREQDLIDFCVSEKELRFIEHNCEIKKVICLTQKAPTVEEKIESQETPAEPVLEVPKKTNTIKKGVTNGKQQPKNKNRPNNKSQV